MRIVDVDARPGRAYEDAEETWVMQEGEAASDPLELPDTPKAGERPVVVLVPTDVRSIRERLARWADAGAPRIARIHPGIRGHGYPLADWLLPPLPEVLDRDGWALGVDPGAARPYPWEPLVLLARRYPALPIVAYGAPLDDRATAPALDATRNLQLAEHGGRDDRAIAVLTGLVRRSGSHRVMAGSGGRSVTLPLPVALSADEHAAIAAGTADSLGSGRWRDQWL